mmetsp:Transcript_23553/g.70593  ORF Transcript_23553/g.70593 Transcript_23553/m.70593 type:complete len:284 (+) Transcript_23553:236-1087(+)
MSAQHASTINAKPRKPPPKKRSATAAAEPVVEGRPHLDDKGRDAIKAQLDAASTGMLGDAATRPLARPIDTATALVEMGAYKKARAKLKEALAVLETDEWRVRFAAERRAVEDALRNLPADDAIFEIQQPKNEAEVGKFDQEPHCTECTCTIEVPAATAPKDVEVTIKRDFLAVKVAGHEKQPHVLFGHLSGTVEVDACAWTLDGAGDNRHLVIQLEKTTDHPCWPKLLRDPVDYWKEDADLDQGEDIPEMRGLKVGETSPVWVSPEEAAKAWEARGGEANRQ